jgi:flagellar biogenesis protein FliO
MGLPEDPAEKPRIGEMKRSILCRAAIVAFLTVCLATMSSSVGGAGQGSPRTNHEIAIGVPSPSEASATSDRPGIEFDALAQGVDPVDGAIDDARGDEVQMSNRNDADEHTSLVNGTFAHEATIGSRLTRSDAGPASESGEHAMTLGFRDERGDADTRFDFLGGRGGDIIQVAGAIGVVLALLFIFRFVMLRAFGGLVAGRPSGVMEILARYPIARGQHLTLLKLGRRVLLVHQTGTAMSTLTEVADPDEVASLLSRIEAGSSGRDADRFRSMLKQYHREHDAASRDGGTARRTESPLTADSAQDSEIVDLTRSQMGGLRNIFGMGGTRR